MRVIVGFNCLPSDWAGYIKAWFAFGGLYGVSTLHKSYSAEDTFESVHKTELYI